KARAAPEPAGPARAWQRMLSGRRLDLLDPSPLDIEIEDIAHGLARVARWNGQTTGAHIFSVADHTLLDDEVARRRFGEPDRRLALALVLHDAPEYVNGEIIPPLKAGSGEAHKAAERPPLRCDRRLCGPAAGEPAAGVRVIKAADRGAAFLEATGLAGFSAADARRFFGPRPILPPAVERDYMTPWSAPAAEQRYLERFARIIAA